MNIRVLLVDDHLVVLKGLRFFLQTRSHIQVVDQAMNGREAIEKVKQLKPDVVLMDLIMPEMNGIEATREIKQIDPSVKIIVLTSFADKDSVLPAIKAGAIGYQLKDVDPEVLVETIEAAMDGNRTLHPQVTNHLIEQMAAGDGKEKSLLTPREQNVLEQITLGKNNKEIAEELYISEKTVKTHITHILSKMELQDRTQAAVYAIRHHWFG